MTTLFAWFGVVFVALIVAGIMMWGIGKLIEATTLAICEHDRVLKDLHTRQIGSFLVSDSYWLSENKDAFLAVKMIGEGLERGGYSISELRNNLEKAIESQKYTSKEKPCG